jgi:hypothetical protein
MNSRKSKSFVIQTFDWNIPVEIKRDKVEDVRGYLILLYYGVDTVFMRTLWDEMTPETILSDIELATRKGNYLCFATMLREINKLKTRDLFGIASDYTSEERRAIFKMWYSAEARSLTHCFQFPLLRGQVSKRFPNGSIKVPRKGFVDNVLGV